jgi:hypothetical protein
MNVEQDWRDDILGETAVNLEASEKKSTQHEAKIYKYVPPRIDELFYQAYIPTMIPNRKETLGICFVHRKIDIISYF